MDETGLGATIRADAAANSGNPKGFLVVASYRVAHAARCSGRPWLAVPASVVHRLLTELLIGLELPAEVVAGPRLRIWHCTGLVVHARTRIGADVVLRHNTTIGTLGDDAGEELAAPVIGDGVSVGAGAIILGPITIGDAAVIGAGSVVVKDVPAGATVVGNPARVVGTAPDR